MAALKSPACAAALALKPCLRGSVQAESKRACHEIVQSARAGPTRRDMGGHDVAHAALQPGADRSCPAGRLPPPGTVVVPLLQR